MAQLLPIPGLPEIGTVRCARPRTPDVRVALRNEADGMNRLAQNASNS